MGAVLMTRSKQSVNTPVNKQTEKRSRTRLVPASRALASKGKDRLGRAAKGRKSTKMTTDHISGLRTWDEIKAMIDAKVRGSDLVFMIDLGPELNEIFVNRDNSDPALVEIGDHPVIVANERSETSRPGDFDD